MILNPEPDDFFFGEDDYQLARLQGAAERHREMLGRVSRLRANGERSAAAAQCRHAGSGYPLSSIAARNFNDPRAGQRGYRCTDCNSVLSVDPWVASGEGVPLVVLHPCEDP